MRKTALVIMAAGLGSRFGTGVKQLAPVGPKGEIIMDYSIYDAMEAGFNKVVFIIRRDLEEEFRRVIGNRIEEKIEVAYAFQEKENLPDGFTCPPDRVKPWGTGQAVLSAREVLKEPFVVINADDYYGKEIYQKAHEYLTADREEGEQKHICMAGFRLKNTLSDNGTVTRGICHVTDGRLCGITETRGILKTDTGAVERRLDGEERELDMQALVSMNMWGLTPAFMEILEKGFVEFLSSLQPEDTKKEYLLPVLIDELIQKGIVAVDVLKTNDTWLGVTYQEDRETVAEEFQKLTAAGVYPFGLWEHDA